MAGFVPGLLAAMALYALTRQVARLPIGMTWEMPGLVLGLIVVMCTASGWLRYGRCGRPIPPTCSDAGENESRTCRSPGVQPHPPPRRFALSLAGVGFAVVLMFVEAGFYNALLDSTVGLIDRFDADLVIVSKVKTTLQAWGGARGGGWPRPWPCPASPTSPRSTSKAPGRSGGATQHFRARRTGRRRRSASRSASSASTPTPGVRLRRCRARRDLRLPDRVLFDRTSEPRLRPARRAARRRRDGPAGPRTSPARSAWGATSCTRATSWSAYRRAPISSRRAPARRCGRRSRHGPAGRRRRPGRGQGPADGVRRGAGRPPAIRRRRRRHPDAKASSATRSAPYSGAPARRSASSSAWGWSWA